MSGIVEKLIKPTVEILEHIGRKIPEALGRGHLRMSKMAHDAADHFDKAEQGLAQDAERDLKGLGGHGGHLPGEGGGAGARAVEGAAARDGEKAAGEAAAKDAGESLRPQDPAKASVPGGERQCETDPVDVATGEMMMPQVDVELPGGLPLILERVHLSSYKHGVWFGPSWASTLDQRLQLDAEGVVFASADGMRLEYPPPRADAAVLPRKGPRLALSWGGTHHDPMRITHPKTGETLVFDHSRPAPGVAAGVVLRLVAIEDRCGRRIDIAWAEDDTPALITHHGGYRIAVECHPELPRITALRLLDADGPGADAVLVRFGYGDTGDLTEIYDSSGVPLRLTYDDRHRVVGWIDRNGTEYAYEYDGAGRVVRTTGSDGFMSGALAYDDETRTTTFTDALGQVTRYEHNDAYRLIRVTDPLGNVTAQQWDEANRHVIAVADPLGRTSRYAFDDAGNLTAVIRPDGSGSSAVYNELNLPTQVVEPGGLVWQLGYDERGNLTTTIAPDGAVTRYAYDAAGFLAGRTDPVGHTYLVGCNAAGLPVSLTDPQGNTTTAVRDAFGRVISTVDPFGHTTATSWTVEGRPAWMQTADGGRQLWEWDPEGNLLAHTTPTGQVTRLTYTHFDLPATRADADGAVHTFTYDAALQLTKVTNPQGVSWSYTYDPAGRLIEERDFAGRTLTYGYDAAGQLVTRTNGAGQTIGYSYDLLGRVIEQDADGVVSSFAYDLAGRLTDAVGGDARLQLAYDPVGRLLTETCNGRTTDYSYDALGRPVRRRTPSGAQTTWTFDIFGQPLTMQTAGRTLTFAYDPMGREIQRNLGALTLTRTWDAVDRITSQALIPSVGAAPADAPRAGRPVQRKAFTYREDGHLVSVTDTTRGRRTWELTGSGRVTAVGGTAEREVYAYDLSGNLTGAHWPAERDRTNTDLVGERHFDGGLLRRAGRASYTYDGQGRVVRQVRKLLSGGSRVWHYTWDAEDRLTSVTTPDGVTWRYRYDPLGRRIAKQRLADDETTVVEETTFAWDGAVLAEQVHTSRPMAAPEITTWHASPGTGTPVAQTHRTVDAGSASQDDIDARFYAIVTDIIGTPTELVDEDGQVAWSPSATLWGAALDDSTATVECPLGFPGQYRDRESGLWYNLFRYYEPQNARYISPDPLGLEPGPNPYSYVHNPQVAADPLGLAPCLQNLEDTAREVAQMLPKRQQEYQTVSAIHAHTPQGPRIFIAGTSKSKLTPAQRKRAMELGAIPLPDEEYLKIPAGQQGGHAEQNLLHFLNRRRTANNGVSWNPTHGAASRSVCTEFCSPVIRASGGLMHGQVYPKEHGGTHQRQFYWPTHYRVSGTEGLL